MPDCREEQSEERDLGKDELHALCATNAAKGIGGIPLRDNFVWEQVGRSSDFSHHESRTIGPLGTELRAAARYRYVASEEREDATDRELQERLTAHDWPDLGTIGFVERVHDARLPYARHLLANGTACPIVGPSC